MNWSKKNKVAIINHEFGHFSLNSAAKEVVVPAGNIRLKNNLITLH